MNYFIDITLLPTDGIGHHFLWSKVFQQTHLALVENKNDTGISLCGVSFPEFNQEKHQLGGKLRIFAPQEKQLEALNLSTWLDRLSDYTHISGISDVPKNIETYVRFTRQQKKSSKERLARRAARRHNISYQQAMLERADFQPHLSNAPFIRLQSLGNGNPFRLLVLKHEVNEFVHSSAGFSSYGLSHGPVLPWF
ncbi:MAG: CRISPR-associated endonuclease Csy4 [Arenicella sp.]|jgi:CRISPR-associated endonuclease Csy4